MTTDQLKNIFGRFENLNLLFLIEDLRRGLVARHFWHDTEHNTLCPVAHGWSHRCEREHGYGDHFPVFVKPWEPAGLDPNEQLEFTSNWDDYGGVDNAELLTALEAIYAERLADADVVQAVCAPASSTRLGFVESVLEPGRLAK